MATTTATNGKKATGFKVPCPHCGAAEGLSLTLHDMGLACSECSEDVSRSDLQRLIDDATRLLRWLEMAATV